MFCAGIYIYIEKDLCLLDVVYLRWTCRMEDDRLWRTKLTTTPATRLMSPMTTSSRENILHFTKLFYMFVNQVPGRIYITVRSTKADLLVQSDQSNLLKQICWSHLTCQIFCSWSVGSIVSKKSKILDLKVATVKSDGL